MRGAFRNTLSVQAYIYTSLRLRTVSIYDMVALLFLPLALLVLTLCEAQTPQCTPVHIPDILPYEQLMPPLTQTICHRTLVCVSVFVRVAPCYATRTNPRSEPA